jgi:hypothetical protein
VHIMVLLDPKADPNQGPTLRAKMDPKPVPTNRPQVRTPNPPWLQNGSKRDIPRIGDIPHETLCRVSLERVSDRT